MNESRWTPNVEAEPLRSTEIRSHIEALGLKPLAVEEWQQGHSVVAVLPDEVRLGHGPYGEMPPSKRPSIAVLQAPSFMRKAFDSEVEIASEYGMPVKYYSIDPKTEELVLVKTSHPQRMNNNPFFLPVANLYDGRDFINTL